MSDETLVALGGQEVGGNVAGRMVSAGGEQGAIGTLMSGRPASAANIRAAGRHWVRSFETDFEVLADGTWRHRASDMLYTALGSDPLLAVSGEQPAHALCDTFVISGDRLVFLRARNQTLIDVEKAEAEQAKKVEQEQARLAKWRAKQPLVPILASEVFGSTFDLTLREAARRVLDAGGVIEADGGGLEIRLPALITGDPISERAARHEVVQAARVLTYAAGTVLAALADGDAKKLVERLPDRPVTLSGRVA